MHLNRAIELYHICSNPSSLIADPLYAESSVGSVLRSMPRKIVTIPKIDRYLPGACTQSSAEPSPRCSFVRRFACNIMLNFVSHGFYYWCRRSTPGPSFGTRSAECWRLRLSGCHCGTLRHIAYQKPGDAGKRDLWDHIKKL